MCEMVINGENLSSLTNSFLFIIKSGFGEKQSYWLYILHNTKIATQDTMKESNILYLSHFTCFVGSFLTHVRCIDVDVRWSWMVVSCLMGMQV